MIGVNGQTTDPTQPSVGNDAGNDASSLPARKTPAWVKAFCTTPDEDPVSFRRFAKEHKPILTTKYPFLINSQIESRLRSMWRKRKRFKKGAGLSMAKKGKKWQVPGESQVFQWDFDKAVGFCSEWTSQVRPVSRTYKRSVSSAYPRLTPPEVISKSPRTSLKSILSKNNEKRSINRVYFDEPVLDDLDKQRKDDSEPGNMMDDFKSKDIDHTGEEDSYQDYQSRYSDSDEDREDQLISLHNPHVDPSEMKKPGTKSVPLSCRNTPSAKLMKMKNEKKRNSDVYSFGFLEGSNTKSRNFIDDHGSQHETGMSQKEKRRSNEMKSGRKSLDNASLHRIQILHDKRQRKITSMFKRVQVPGRERGKGLEDNFGFDDLQEAEEESKITPAPVSRQGQNTPVAKEVKIVDLKKVDEEAKTCKSTIDKGMTLNDGTPAMSPSLLAKTYKKASRAPRKKWPGNNHQDTHDRIDTRGKDYIQSNNIVDNNVCKVRRSLEADTLSVPLTTSSGQAEHDYMLQRPSSSEMPMKTPCLLGTPTNSKSSKRLPNGVTARSERMSHTSPSEKRYPKNDILSTPAKNTRSCHQKNLRKSQGNADANRAIHGASEKTKRNCEVGTMETAEIKNMTPADVFQTMPWVREPDPGIYDNKSCRETELEFGRKISKSQLAIKVGYDDKAKSLFFPKSNDIPKQSTKEAEDLVRNVSPSVGGYLLSSQTELFEENKDENLCPEDKLTTDNILTRKHSLIQVTDEISKSPDKHTNIRMTACPSSKMGEKIIRNSSEQLPFFKVPQHPLKTSWRTASKWKEVLKENVQVCDINGKTISTEFGQHSLDNDVKQAKAERLMHTVNRDASVKERFSSRKEQTPSISATLKTRHTPSTSSFSEIDQPAFGVRSESTQPPAEGGIKAQGSAPFKNSVNKGKQLQYVSDCSEHLKDSTNQESYKGGDFNTFFTSKSDYSKTREHTTPTRNSSSVSLTKQDGDEDEEEEEIFIEPFQLQEPFRIPLRKIIDISPVLESESSEEASPLVPATPNSQSVLDKALDNIRNVMSPDIIESDSPDQMDLVVSPLISVESELLGGKNTSGYEIFANKFAGSGDEKMLIEDPVCSWQETPNTKSNIENTCMTLCNKDEKGGSTVTSLETHEVGKFSMKGDLAKQFLGSGDGMLNLEGQNDHFGREAQVTKTATHKSVCDIGERGENGEVSLETCDSDSSRKIDTRINVEDTMPHSSQQVLDNLFDDPHPPAIDILVQQTPRSSTRRLVRSKGEETESNFMDLFSPLVPSIFL